MYYIKTDPRINTCMGPRRGSNFIKEIYRMNVKNILKNYDDKICDVSVQALSNGVDSKSYKQYLPGQP